MEKKTSFNPNQNSGLPVDFKDVDMSNSSEIWTDAMSRSIFNFQDGLKISPRPRAGDQSDPLYIPKRRNNKFANKFR